MERRDSWSNFVRQELERLTARFVAGDHRGYRPYLVRSVSKFGDGGMPVMLGDLCGCVLRLMTLTLLHNSALRSGARCCLPTPRTGTGRGDSHRCLVTARECPRLQPLQTFPQRCDFVTEEARAWRSWCLPFSRKNLLTLGAVSDDGFQSL